MNEILLEMKNVTKQFPGVIALDKVNIELKKGEILGVCGENGAGKSTLVKILSGSYAAGTYEGEIFINGKAVKMVSVAVAESYGIEMIYQEINMMPDLSIGENMYVGNLPGKGQWVDFKTLYKNTKDRLNSIRVKASPKSKVKSLGSGQMQLISLMRAYVRNPEILVLDEPTSSLTDTDIDIMMDMITRLRNEGKSCIYISHKLEEVFRICDSVVVLRDGKTISHRPIKEATKNMLVEEMVGRKVTNFFPKEHIKLGEEIMQIEDLTVPHPMILGKNIVENISFNLRKGEILSLGGLVGAGRSEVLGAIFGQYYKGVSKKVYIGGKEINIKTPRDAINAGLGFLTEEKKLTGLVWMLSVMKNLTLASLPDLPGRFFINKRVEMDMAKGIFDRLRIKAPSLNTIVVTLSGGNQQKVVLGKWLLKQRIHFLLIDEPTKGIDVGAKTEIYKIMGELVKSGVSIIMVSSEMPELIAMSDRCIVLNKGRITCELVGDEITKKALICALIA